MIALIEKELEIKDQELSELVNTLPMDTVPNVSARMDSLTTEKQILHKLLKQQKLQKRKSLFAMENGLLLFAIGMFGALAAFVFYLFTTPGVAQGTWEQLGSDMAVLLLLFVMTFISSALYFQQYKQNHS